jgi:hypothetical protein
MSIGCCFGFLVGMLVLLWVLCWGLQFDLDILVVIAYMYCGHLGLCELIQTQTICRHLGKA